MEIKNNTVVSMRYIMKNNKGDVLEDNINADPIEYVHGSGSILPSLESSLNGLRPGETKSVFISDMRLRGTFYFSIVIDDVRDATKEEIETGKSLRQVQNNGCGPGCCC